MTQLKNVALTVVGVFIALAGFAFFASFGLAVVGALAFLTLSGTLAAVFATPTAPEPKPVDIQ